MQRKRGQRTVSMTRADDADGDDGAEWDIADESPIAEDALADLQQLNLLRHALDRLDERCRDLLLLLFRDEDDKLSYEEVARRLGMSVGSIGADPRALPGQICAGSWSKPVASTCISALRTLLCCASDLRPRAMKPLDHLDRRRIDPPGAACGRACPMRRAALITTAIGLWPAQPDRCCEVAR